MCLLEGWEQGKGGAVYATRTLAPPHVPSRSCAVREELVPRLLYDPYRFLAYTTLQIRPAGARCTRCTGLYAEVLVVRESGFPS